MLMHKEAPGFLYHLSQFFNDPDKSGKAGLFVAISSLASRTILMLPSSALGQKQAARAGNAKIAGVTSVTKEFLAHIIIQIWFALSSGQEWDETIGLFNLKAFYYAMIAAYNNLNHLRIKRMTKWLNKRVQISGKNHVIQGVGSDSCLGKDMALWAMEADEDVEPEDDEPSSGPPSSDDSSSPGVGSGSSTADSGTAGSGTAGPDGAGPGNADAGTGGDA
ncbi:hypothetical protein PM082_010051 [Marasmius tenuissimus]|nr:hypothetical protein PM082_010051 [Marasmius tenuissimus]